MSQPLVCFSHGKDSSPWGSKIRALARTAEGVGFGVISIDYRGEPDPEVRVEQLLRECPRDHRPLVLVGSSLGAYVATVASRTLRPAGLFLFAPAFYIEGYREQAPLPAALVAQAREMALTAAASPPDTPDSEATPPADNAGPNAEPLAPSRPGDTP